MTEKLTCPCPLLFCKVKSSCVGELFLHLQQDHPYIEKFSKCEYGLAETWDLSLKKPDYELKSLGTLRLYAKWLPIEEVDSQKRLTYIKFLLVVAYQEKEDNGGWSAMKINIHSFDDRIPCQMIIKLKHSSDSGTWCFQVPAPPKQKYITILPTVMQSCVRHERGKQYELLTIFLQVNKVIRRIDASLSPPLPQQ
jgi:hypothetical protein